MISYCIASYRPTYSKLLVDDLIHKTTTPYEILVWLNIEDMGFEDFLKSRISEGAPIRIVGKTPENIGMGAYFELFNHAQFELVTQIDDDVVMVSPNIAETAKRIFDRFHRVKQLVADVWQDEFTTGARPEMHHYRPFSRDSGLFAGPIDGWFSVYHRSVLPLIPRLPGEYFPLGGATCAELSRQGLRGLLCTQFKVFHVIGPQYASFFDMLDFEIEKYKRLGRGEIVEWYERDRQNLPSRELLSDRVRSIARHLA